MSSLAKQPEASSSQPPPHRQLEQDFSSTQAPSGDEPGDFAPSDAQADPQPTSLNIPGEQAQQYHQPPQSIPYIEPEDAADLLPPRPSNFAPFYTLIEDTSTGDHHHPAVHYIFRDDEPDLLTAALMRVLGSEYHIPSDPDLNLNPAPDPDPDPDLAPDYHPADEHHDPVGASPLPPPLPGVREQYLLIDVGPDGRHVVGAHSLSADWQVTETEIRPAPTWEEEAAAAAEAEAGGEEGAEGAEGVGLMMRIVGTAAEAPGAAGRAKGKGKGKGNGRRRGSAEDAVDARLRDARAAVDGDLVAALEGLAGRFEREMRVLETIMSAGGGEAGEGRERGQSETQSSS